jgi:hypothetical protein
MSRVKPGYFTDFNAFFTCSSEIDMHQDYVCCVRGKLCVEFSSIRNARTSGVGDRALAIANFFCFSRLLAVP